MRDAAYASFTDDDRVLGHRLAAEWLEKAGEADAFVLAEHFRQGAAPDRAVAYYLLAARRALEGNDVAAALDRAARGLACGDDLGDDARRSCSSPRPRRTAGSGNNVEEPRRPSPRRSGSSPGAATAG